MTATQATTPCHEEPASICEVPRLTRTVDGVQFLTEIERLIREDPRRLYQGTWIESVVSTITGPSIYTRVVDRLQPACGTAGCIAGWGTLLLRSAGMTVQNVDQAARQITSEKHLGLGSVGPGAVIARVLRLSNQQADALFKADVGEDLSPGTPEYVENVLRRIRNFKANHSKQLRAVTVRPGSVRIHVTT